MTDEQPDTWTHCRQCGHLLGTHPFGDPMPDIVCTDCEYSNYQKAMGRAVQRYAPMLTEEQRTALDILVMQKGDGLAS